MSSAHNVWSGLPLYLVLLAVLGGQAANQLSQDADPAPPPSPADSQPNPVQAAAAPADANAPPFQYLTNLLDATCTSSELAPEQREAAGRETTPTRDAATEFSGEELARVAAQCARRRLEARDIRLDAFVVVTIPDYIDSNSGWAFDPLLDALQRAAAAAGFVPHRFHLPDWTPGGKTNSVAGTRHEREPGVIFFQRNGAAGRLELLALLLVTETPTQGLHERAFLEAVRLIDAWQTAPFELRVLGPGFSGTSDSLRGAIARAVNESSRHITGVHVLSGTATSRPNAERLNVDLAPTSRMTKAGLVPVRYEATVRADDAMLHALHDHLIEINPAWQAGRGVALLVESDTSYGRAIGGDNERDIGDTYARDPFSQAMRIPFPIHVSRLRAQAARGTPKTPGGPHAFTLDLRDHRAISDTLPSMSPDATAASVDAVVAQIFETIRREGYGAIGIFATDKRDHLFLAERLTREVPNALLFTTEADLLFTNPEFRPFVRGTVVASTYPLFNATQSVTNPTLAAHGRQQFVNQGSQGTYNALLRLLGRDDLLLDYWPPSCVTRDEAGRDRRCRIPPVWIEVVGQNGLWPLDSHDDNRMVRELERWEAYTAAVAAPSSRALAGPAGPHPLLTPSVWMKGAFVAVIAGLLLFGGAYLAKFTWWRSHVAAKLPTPRSWTTSEVGGLRILRADIADSEALGKDVTPQVESAHCLWQEHRQFLLIAFAVVSFVAVWATPLFHIWASGDVGRPMGVSSGAAAAIWRGGYLAITGLVLWESWRTMHARRKVAPSDWLPGTLVTAVALALTFPTGLGLADFISLDAWSAPETGRLMFVRIANPANWVSPAVPVLAIAAAMCWWSVWNIRCLLIGSWRFTAKSALMVFLVGRDYRLAGQLADTIASPWRVQSWRTLAMPFAVLVAYICFVPIGRSPDGAAFDRFLWWGSLLVLFLAAHALSQAMHVWLLLRHVLGHLASHPIREALGALGKLPLDWRLRLAPPPAMALEPMLLKARVLRGKLLGLLSARGTPVTSGPIAPVECRRSAGWTEQAPSPRDARAVAAGASLAVRAGDTRGLLPCLAADSAGSADALGAADSQRAYFNSRDWDRLLAWSSGLVPVLEHGFWRRGRSTGDTALDAWYQDGELLVGMQVAFVIRDLLARLVSGTTTAVGGAALALAAHLFYSFPGRSAMLSFDWTTLALLVAVIAAILISLERNHALRMMWSSSPERPGWTEGFVYRLAIYALVPVMTLFAWQFPEATGSLMFWMEPLKKAIS